MAKGAGKFGRLAVFGEVLFDEFPDGKQVLGGAPFNVAWHLQAFGQRPLFISRVGDDSEGRRVRAEMEGWGMDTDGLQTDLRLPTGSVSVRFADGEPRYDIAHPVAFDAIAAPAGGATHAEDFRLLYHGSLALRERTSRRALERLRESHPGIIFVDVNLRPPWWQRDQVLECLSAAKWVKLNRDELAQLGSSGTGAGGRPADLLNRLGLAGLVVTHGDRGAELITAEGEHHRIRPEGDIEVVDTVGAGDAFVAVIILGLAEAWPLGVTLKRAQLFASRLCGRQGATVRDLDFYQAFREDWKSV